MVSSILKFNFWLKFCVKILFCKHYFRPLSTYTTKGKDPDPYLWLMDRDPGGPKTCGSGSPTLIFNQGQCFALLLDRSDSYSEWPRTRLSGHWIKLHKLRIKSYITVDVRRPVRPLFVNPCFKHPHQFGGLLVSESYSVPNNCTTQEKLSTQKEWKGVASST
jgi:hypothetical protein